MQHKSAASRRRLHRVLFCALLVGLCCLSSVYGAAEGPHDEAIVASAVQPFELPNVSTLLELLSEPSAASPQAAHPILVLFTDQVAEDHTVDAVQSKVRQLATHLPPSLVRVHEFSVPATTTERRLADLVLGGVASRLPALILFHSNVYKAQVIPGSFIATAPLSVPLPYPKPDELRQVSYMELRTWVLSEMPARYIDPVTFHLVPSLQFVFRSAEILETLRLVQRTVESKEGRSVLPAVVSMAYVRLTTHGSEEVVAALSSVTTQAGNAVLMLVTESAEVAAAWGLVQEHTISTAPWSSVEAAYLLDGNITSSNAHQVVVRDASPAQSIGAIEEVVEATVASPHWQTAAEVTNAALTSQLRSWLRAMESFNATSPLRKIDSAAHLIHELVSLQQAIKVMFVLRESDEMWFHHHLDVAVKLAARLQQMPVLYNTTTLSRNAKVPSRVVRSWSPSIRVEVFWVDAEQLPDVADGLFVAQVPSVLVLAPLQSRFQEGADVEEGQEEVRSSEAGLRSRDPVIGVHVVNRYDLFTAAFTNDAAAVMDAPTGKDALPAFPADCDALVRFLASESFPAALQSVLRPVRLSHLRASLLTHTTATSTSGHQDEVPLFSFTSSLPNRRYAQLDHRYYPLRLAEEPMEGPAYVRQILNGSSPLPVMTDEERQRLDAHSREEKTDAAAKHAKAALAAKKVAAWEAELAKRRREKEARMQRKAADDAAVRAKQNVEFQKSVEAAFREEAEAEANLGGIDDGMPGRATWAAGELLVRRPPMEMATRDEAPMTSFPYDGRIEQEDAEDAAQRARRRRRYAQYKEWQADRERMVGSCVSVKEGQELSLRFKWN
ncbi:hypothetical protein ABL78_7874 [Leptomonas seymouri]|uniref:Membrane-associated protein n=1 Tax=Leptomonas seymouri TaxID=5684 RepID=A0A0N0P2L9_LEPSE|nr:hypothetical protein ABL78_7874 [Leptomonas seymouri]|eukprot:KPI83106.1 hypothetical protein ABL78_7874 [Leptomonas seymouri]